MHRLAVLRRHLPHVDPTLAVHYAMMLSIVVSFATVFVWQTNGVLAERFDSIAAALSNVGPHHLGSVIAP